MYDPKQFYFGYIADYHYQKVTTLQSLLNNSDGLKTRTLSAFRKKDPDDVPEKKVFDQWVRAEIRATYYHAIETLFEIIRALFDSKKADDLNLWYHFSTSKFNKTYDWIESVSRGELDFLNRQIVGGKRKDGKIVNVSFGKYLFYWGIDNPNDNELVDSSLEVIKEILQEYAREFVQRDEYNALKHGMRIFPTLKKFEWSTDKETWVTPFDIEGSMTFLTKGKPGMLKLNIVPMDTERDIRMTDLCSALIASILKARSLAFKVSTIEKRRAIFITKADWKRASNRNKKYLNLDLEITSPFE